MTNNIQKSMGFIGQSISLIFKLIFWSLLAWLIALLGISILVLFWGKNMAYHYSEDLYIKELYFLEDLKIVSQRSRLTIGQADNHEIVTQIPNNDLADDIDERLPIIHWLHWAIDWLLIKTKIIASLEWLSQKLKWNSNEMTLFISGEPLSQLTATLVMITKVIVFRILTLFLSLPLFLLFAFIGLMEGLSQRDIRRFSGARESTLLFHYVKRGIKPCLMGAWLIYLLTPVSLSPQCILVPLAVVQGVMVALSARAFKKYF